MCALLCSFFFTIYLSTSPTGGAAARSVRAIRVNWLLIFHSTFYLGAVNLKARATAMHVHIVLRGKICLIIIGAVDIIHN